MQPSADLGPGGRAAFDELTGKTPAAARVTYEAATVGGVPGWWCRPADAVPDAAILLDDARRYAGRLVKAGVVAELHVWEGMVHVFPANLALLRAAREALDGAGDFLRHNLVAERTAEAIR